MLLLKDMPPERRALSALSLIYAVFVAAEMFGGDECINPIRAAPT